MGNKKLGSSELFPTEPSLTPPPYCDRARSCRARRGLGVRLRAGLAREDPHARDLPALPRRRADRRRGHRRRHRLPQRRELSLPDRLEVPSGSGWPVGCRAGRGGERSLRGSSQARGRPGPAACPRHADPLRLQGPADRGLRVEAGDPARADRRGHLGLVAHAAWGVAGGSRHSAERAG